MDPNPVKQAREYLGLSINELEVLSDVHRQVIIRTEQGTYNVIPPRLYSFLVSRLGEGIPSLAINYQSWVAEKRLSSFGALVNEMPPFDSEKHPFVFWREISGLGRLEVCKLFCVHVSTLTRFETNLSMQSVPSQLVDALIQSGYDSGIIDKLSTRYHLYRRLKLAIKSGNIERVRNVRQLIKSVA